MGCQASAAGDDLASAHRNDNVGSVKAIKNKTRRPLVVPLPRGKKLHLGPGKTGQIAAEAAEHPGLVKLAEAGDIEILDETQAALETGGGSKIGRGAGGSQGPGGVMRRSGDR
jgi:hypothetical protein